ncbi:GntR family transcriptional regulator [Psychrobacter aestuarii]|uniref:GntR family transcriptional regulator n=1 Tax=Psychrobacter aestuarii TaxID=556327 RepID=A0ABN0VJN4_9GAMM|nr:GntR family transcriptional regulator [Psychrobacter aestuarii]
MSLIDDLPLSVQVSKKIEDDIIYGRLPPGTKLDEATLCDKYGVSRTPIREALKLLASEGLVEIRPRRGAVVPTLNIVNLFEMFEVMAYLEGMCGRLAARRISEDEKRELLQLHEECQQYLLENNPESYYEANRQFHFFIYQLSHNSFLTEQATTLHNRLHPYRRLQLRVNNRMQHSFDEHQSIVDAIINADEDAAESLIKAHVSIQGERFTDLVATMSPETAQ